MNQLKSFNHKQFGELQVILVNEKEYFSATDVAKSLEYKQPHTAVKSHCHPEGVITYNVPTNGGNQNKRFISMGNVPRLIVGAAKQSRNPKIREKATMYEKWIFDEVIPSIHRTGSYQTEQPKNQLEILQSTVNQLVHQDKRITNLEETMRIDGRQEQIIKKRANHIVVEALGGKSTNAYKTMAFKVFSAFWRDFKNHFEIPRYGDLPKKQFEEGLRFIGMWTPSTSLRIEIDEANRQQTIEVV
ncbi:ORF6C domain-containing protein [Piscibacillus sp. B03]|uniref:ORF6C domain-containing protein n=1 Tax=Piscibacillus sp. B03 TaxID=3457430 RepID=UPI003FCE1B75